MILAAALGIILWVIGYIYISHPASSLPSFFPGYQAGYPYIHLKHAVAAIILGLACFIYAWFQSGKKKTT